MVGLSSLLITMSGASCSRTLPPPYSSARLFRYGENAIYFIGHATTLIHLNGVTLLTDPIFSDKLALFSRKRAAGMALDRLPHLDAILISHSHRDHLDEWTLRRLPRDVPLFIPRGNGQYPRDWGHKNVRELEAGDKVRLGSVEIIATPAKHSGARNSARDPLPHALGYLIRGAQTVYFAGDTALFEAMRQIGRIAPIDLALLPIGAYRPRWITKNYHMSPSEALQAMATLKAKKMIPIHWGSFRMAFDGIDEPRDMLVSLLKNDQRRGAIPILYNGERLLLGR